MARSAHLRPANDYSSRASARRRVVNLGAEHENLDQKAYQILKSMIIERQLLPGDKIPQEKLAEDLGISRTPLINALKFLEHEKLVQSIPRRGFFVRLFDKAEMISIFELRELLEGLSARRACQNITDRGIEQLKGFFPAICRHEGHCRHQGLRSGRSPFSQLADRHRRQGIPQEHP